MGNFGELLEELRQDRKLTQEQLGKELHVTAGTISNYENNVHFPDVEKLIDLADYFSVTTDYLLGRTSSNLSLDAFSELAAPGKTIGAFVENFKELPLNRRQALLLIMQDMKISMMLNQYKKEI